MRRGHMLLADMTSRERRAYRQGIEDACSLMEQWDRYVLHRFRVSDAIRFKLCLIRRRDVRPHPIISGDRP